jgi:hypothetical protein
VDHGDALQAVPLPDALGDGEHGAQRAGVVGGVLQLLDGFPAKVVSCGACTWGGKPGPE